MVVEIWVAGVRIYMDEKAVHDYIFNYYKSKGYTNEDAENVAIKVVEREKKREEEKKNE